VDFDYAYGLHSNGIRLAIFAEDRVGYREWTRRRGRLDTIHALDDKYDHDIDVLVSQKNGAIILRGGGLSFSVVACNPSG
jgi:hypothetical protein